MKQSAKHSEELRGALVRDLVQQNLVQLGRLDAPAGSPKSGSPAPGRRHRGATLTSRMEAPARRRRIRLRLPLMLLGLAYVSVFGTSAFRQGSVVAPSTQPPKAETLNPELLEDLDQAASLPEGLPMSWARMFHLRAKRIVLDPGHGGKDPGARAPSGLEEKAVTLAIARLLAPMLEAATGAEVILTREEDLFLPLEERAEVANRVEADLFLSIHLNWFPNAGIQRVEMYYVGVSSDQEALETASRENAAEDVRLADFELILRRMAHTLKLQESRRFAELTQEALFEGVRKRNLALRNQGVRRAPFIVLTGTRMPSILAEVSFLSNPEEARRLATAVHLESIAASLCTGIVRYLAAEPSMAVAQAAPAAR